MLIDLPPFERELFFAAPIGAPECAERPRNDAVFEVIVEEAAARLGLTAVRADHIAEPGDITTQVIEHVLQAAAVVVDVTGRNANVFYELGIRHAACKPVVLISEDRDLPFDIAQLRTVFFSSTDLRSGKECVAAVASQLKAAMAGGGYSPVTTALERASLAAGGPVERGITEILAAIEGLSARLPSPAARHFGSALKRARRGAGLSMAEVATRAGMPRDALESIENGERTVTLTTIVRLAGALEVDPADLVEAVDVVERFGE